MIWLNKTFDELTSDELYELLNLRSEVFVVEQDCIYNDMDGFDKDAIHVLGFDKTHLAAYARILPPGTRYKNISIGRVVVDPKSRGKSLGKQLMKQSIELVKTTWGKLPVNISAQLHLEKFYADLGFRTVSDVYLEDGIPHLKMEYSFR